MNEQQSDHNLLADFWSYCSNYEITRNNAIWAAMGALAGAVNRKVYTKIGDIRINCNLYILLVGSPGSGKSTGMGFSNYMFQAACPEIQLGPSKQSHGDIIKFMASGECKISYTNNENKPDFVNVYNFFIDEFKNFVAYDIIGMLNFLTGVYGKDDRFDASTLARGAEDIEHPNISFVACENPSWMIRHIKNDSISDGLGRRVIIVYELEDAPPKPHIIITPEITAIVERIVTNLKKIKTFCGEYKHTPESQAYYNKWYAEKHAYMLTITDQVFRGYIRTLHIQMLKCAMLIDCASGNPSYKFSIPLLQSAIAMLASIQTNIPKLFIGAGRNELSAEQQNLIDLINNNGGEFSEREVLRITTKNLNPSEQISVIEFLKKTGQLYRVQMPATDKSPTKWMFLTTLGYDKAVKEGRIGKLS